MKKMLFIFLVTLVEMGFVSHSYRGEISNPQSHTCQSDHDEDTVWGFFGHRKINRMAVFTLPIEMIPLFKSNIEFITEHAVDPDKRRYAVKEEAIRHYIDIDHWGEDGIKEVPREFSQAFWKYAKCHVITGADTVSYDSLFYDEHIHNSPQLNRFYDDVLEQRRYDGEISISKEERELIEPLKISAFRGADKVILEDIFSGYGILPYHLTKFYKRLVGAFRTRNQKSILRYAAEIGHYIGDAHVPLHTTENYNGQLTNQLGIHAFWESRIPELFADEYYDFFVGKAEYIGDINSYAWKVVNDSHILLDSVLSIEKRLTETISEDRQFCFDERLEKTIRTQCPEFAALYSNEMDGMVEDRMRASIQSLGSVWMSAWIDAGRPDITAVGFAEWTEKDKKESKELDASYRRGAIYGREH
jgi:hypothetical protein